MISKETLPPSLSGLNARELARLAKLPWKKGKFKGKGTPTKELSFLLNSGRLETNDMGLIAPAQELLGIKPFLRQPKREYSVNFEHELSYINTESLADFFFMHPRAMQSYISMESNLGYEPLSNWKDIPNQWLVISDRPSWESIHFSLAIAHYQAERFNSRSIYLEFQTEGLSIFNLLDMEPKPALVQAEENPGKLNQLLNERLVQISDSIDVLNIHFLSVWKLSQEQWSTLFWQLGKYYDNIIIHLGTDKLSFLYEQSNTIFAVTSSSLYQLENYELENNWICWPPVLDIRRKKAQAKHEKGVIEYPLGQDDFNDQTVKMPYEMAESDGFWSWFKSDVEHFLEPYEAVIISDYLDNFAGFMAVIKTLWKLSSEKKILKNSLNNSIIFPQGKSGILGSVAALSKNWHDFHKKCKNLVDYDVTSVLKPIFPTSSLFSDKPIQRYLKNLFPTNVQDGLNLFFPIISYENRDILFLSSGSLSENLIRSTFVPGFVETGNLDIVESNQKDIHMRTFGRTNRNDWINILANCFRTNFKKVKLINFLQPPKQKSSDILAKKLLFETSNMASYSSVTGLFSQIINVPTSNKKYLKDQEEEIYNMIKRSIK